MSPNQVTRIYSVGSRGGHHLKKKDLTHGCWLEDGGGHVGGNARGCGWLEEGVGCRART